MAQSPPLLRFRSPPPPGWSSRPPPPPPWWLSRPPPPPPWWPKDPPPPPPWWSMRPPPPPWWRTSPSSKSSSKGEIVVGISIFLLTSTVIYIIVSILSMAYRRSRARAGAGTGPRPTPERRAHVDGRQLHGASTASPTAHLPAFTYSPSVKHNLTGDGEEVATCSVCLGVLQLGETVRLLPCLHLYHVECIDPWLDAHSTCPLCRSGTEPTMDARRLPPV